MKFKSLKIDEFRGIKKLEIDDFSRINLLLGKNNCGKSSVLESLFLLTGLYTPILSINIDRFRKLLHNEADDFRFLFYNLDYDSKLKLYSEMFGTENETRQLKIYPISSNRNISSSYTIAGDNSSNSTTSLAMEYDGIEYDVERKKRHSQTKNHKTRIIFTKDDQNIEIKEQQPLKEKNDFKALFQYADSTSSLDIVNRIEKRIIEKRKDELIDWLRVVDSKISDIYIARNGLIYFDIGAQKYIPANLMGDGIIKMLHLVTNLHEMSDGVLLVDEIDNGLHYSVIEKVWEIILKVSSENNIQVFATTHNYEVMSLLIKVLNNEKYSNLKELIRAFTLIKHNGDEVKSFKYEFDMLKHLIEQNSEVRGLI